MWFYLNKTLKIGHKVYIAFSSYRVTPYIGRTIEKLAAEGLATFTNEHVLFANGKQIVKQKAERKGNHKGSKPEVKPPVKPEEKKEHKKNALEG
jgi:hypothetical protein